MICRRLAALTLRGVLFFALALGACVPTPAVDQCGTEVDHREDDGLRGKLPEHS